MSTGADDGDDINVLQENWMNNVLLVAWLTFISCWLSNVTTVPSVTCVRTYTVPDYLYKCSSDDSVSGCDDIS